MSRHVRVFTALVVLAGVLVPSLVLAQDRGRVLVGVGGGFGSSGVSCDDCDADRENGGAGYFKLGVALDDRTLLGFESNIWWKTVEDGAVTGTLNLYNIAGTITHYPTGSGFFVKGGLGASFVDIEAEADGSTVSADLGKGLGILAGAGFDIRLGNRVSLTPAVNIWYGRPGDLTLLGETLASNFSHNVIDFTIGVTFR